MRTKQLTRLSAPAMLLVDRLSENIFCCVSGNAVIMMEVFSINLIILLFLINSFRHFFPPQSADQLESTRNFAWGQFRLLEGLAPIQAPSMRTGTQAT